MRQIPWSIGNEEIPYFIGHNCANSIVHKVATLSPPPEKVFIVVDEAVWSIHGQRFESAFENNLSFSTFLMSSLEAIKTLTTVEKIMMAAFNEGVTRNSVVLAMGGGIVGNTAGLAAALLFRGIRFVHVPTTFLSMHDSVTSLKQGVNCNGTKNLIGTYYRPEAIYADIHFLEDLPAEEIRSGFVELIKNVLISGHDLEEIGGIRYNRCLTLAEWERVIELGVIAKQKGLHKDPFERSTALIFEYGHTIGHALELTYQDELSHGDAVAWGMHCAGLISLEMGFMNGKSYQNHEALLDLISPLPKVKNSFSTEKIISRVGLDNKRGISSTSGTDEFPFVLLHKIGQVVKHDYTGIPLVPVPKRVLINAINELKCQWFRSQPSPLLDEKHMRRQIPLRSKIIYNCD